MLARKHPENKVLIWHSSGKKYTSFSSSLNLVFPELDRKVEEMELKTVNLILSCKEVGWLDFLKTLIVHKMSGPF